MRIGGAGSGLEGGRGAAAAALLAALLVAGGCRQLPLDADGGFVGRVVVADGRDWGSDQYAVESAAVDGDRLTIEFSYAGGCQDHDFTLVLSSSFAESDPARLSAHLAHDANGDMCQAWLTNPFVFDLALVRERYQRIHGSGPGRVVLDIRRVPGDGLVYEFR